MAPKRRNMFYKNKNQETTEVVSHQSHSHSAHRKVEKLTAEASLRESSMSLGDSAEMDGHNISPRNTAFVTTREIMESSNPYSGTVREVNSPSSGDGPTTKSGYAPYNILRERYIKKSRDKLVLVSMKKETFLEEGGDGPHKTDSPRPPSEMNHQEGHGTFTKEVGESTDGYSQSSYDANDVNVTATDTIPSNVTIGNLEDSNSTKADIKVDENSRSGESSPVHSGSNVFNETETSTQVIEGRGTSTKRVGESTEGSSQSSYDASDVNNATTDTIPTNDTIANQESLNSAEAGVDENLGTGDSSVGPTGSDKSGTSTQVIEGRGTSTKGVGESTEGSFQSSYDASDVNNATTDTIPSNDTIANQESLNSAEAGVDENLGTGDSSVGPTGSDKTETSTQVIDFVPSNGGHVVRNDTFVSDPSSNVTSTFERANVTKPEGSAIVESAPHVSVDGSEVNTGNNSTEEKLQVDIKTQDVDNTNLSMDSTSKSQTSEPNKMDLIQNQSLEESNASPMPPTQISGISESAAQAPVPSPFQSRSVNAHSDGISKQEQNVVSSREDPDLVSNVTSSSDIMGSREDTSLNAMDDQQNSQIEQNTQPPSDQQGGLTDMGQNLLPSEDSTKGSDNVSGISNQGQDITQKNTVVNQPISSENVGIPGSNKTQNPQNPISDHSFSTDTPGPVEGDSSHSQNIAQSPDYPGSNKHPGHEDAERFVKQNENTGKFYQSESVKAEDSTTVPPHDPSSVSSSYGNQYATGKPTIPSASQFYKSNAKEPHYYPGTEDDTKPSRYTDDDYAADDDVYEGSFDISPKGPSLEGSSPLGSIESSNWFSSISSFIGVCKELFSSSEVPISVQDLKGELPDSGVGHSTDESLEKRSTGDRATYPTTADEMYESGHCEKEEDMCNTAKEFSPIAEQLESDVPGFSEKLAFNAGVENLSLHSIMTLVLTAVVVLLFSLGYYYIEYSRRDGSLVGKINALESELFLSKKEQATAEDQLSKANEEIASFSSEITKRNTCIAKLQEELKEAKDKQTSLEETVSHQEKEIETLMENTEEMHRLLSDAISDEDRSHLLLSNIGELKESLAARLAENISLTEQLDMKNREIQLLHMDVKTSTDKQHELEQKLSTAFSDVDDRVLKATEPLKEQVIKLEQSIAEKTSDCARLESELLQARNKCETLVARCETVERGLREAHNVRSNEALAKWTEATQVRTNLSKMEAKLQEMDRELHDSVETRNRLEGRLNDMRVEMVALNEKYETAEKEKIEALTQLQVLSNYFREKETQLQEELGLKEAQWLKKQSEGDTIYEQMRALREENMNYRTQNEMLKKEIIEQETAFKKQIADEELKARENWVTLRQTERRLKEVQTEAAQLRSRFTALASSATHSGDGQLSPNGLEPNGDSPYAPSGGAVSPPFMLPPPPPIPMGFPRDFVPLPPQGGPHPPLGQDGPPPPLPPPGRPPPLGRISSPPLVVPVGFTPPPPLLPYELFPARLPPQSLHQTGGGMSPPPLLPHHVHKPQPKREQKGTLTTHAHQHNGYNVGGGYSTLLCAVLLAPGTLNCTVRLVVLFHPNHQVEDPVDIKSIGIICCWV
ncbi:hypothetical protein AAG570_003564 [Ranatra chinensis]|uniref:Transport and Golgi organization protein 1 n=1 Tax=Ranatra chinensis TaxID=642074 RepID=A0ABD0YSJ7_9HEMI